MAEEQNYCLQDKRMPSTVIRSYLNDADVSVSSKTIGSRLADVRLKEDFFSSLHSHNNQSLPETSTARPSPPVNNA
ncbi:hypothetical protein TNCV_4621601 [Trichonephila clavipes]|nr:hypothetical protein TNCV_4621601 [Trichonephila clavipes]